MASHNQPAVGPAKGRSSVGRILLLLAVGAALGALIFFAAPRFLTRFFSPEEQTATYPRLPMGGTSTGFVLVENGWKTKYRADKGVDLVYESTGTTAGVNRLLDGTFTVAFTHGPLSAEQRQKAKAKGDVLQIPVVLCGVAPVYNVKEMKGKAPLRLTGAVLADIFRGEIKRWDDAALKELNPGVELPATAITVVHREDSSGTTQIFTEYLAAVSPAWAKNVGPPASEVQWPVGVAARRNLGVATLVDRSEGAIGYVDRTITSYEDMTLEYAAVQNRDKSAFVRAEPENITAAAAGSLGEVADDLGFDLTNKPGKDAYPISGLIYAVCYESQPGETRPRVVDFLRWATNEGQPRAARMSYALLPDELVRKIDKKLESIRATP